MSKSLVIPKARKLCETDPGLVDSIFDLVRAGNVAEENVKIMKGVQSLPDAPDVHQEVAGLLRPHLLTGRLRFGVPLPVVLEIDTRPAEPGQPQRASEFHRDMHLAVGEEAAVFSDKLPTCFVFGEVPLSHPFSKLYHEISVNPVARYSQAEAFHEQALAALVAGYLEPQEDITEYTVAIFDSRHIHKGTLNTGSTTVQKGFVRVTQLDWVAS